MGDKSLGTASTMEDLVNQNVMLAMREAKRQLEEGTASSQIITKFLVIGVERESLERKKLELEIDLMRARINNTEASTEVMGLKDELLNAIKMYTGGDDEEFD